MTIRRRSTPPSYRLHKSTGQAIVVLDGKTIYLGLYDSPQSHIRYKRELAAWLSSSTHQPSLKEVSPSVAQPESALTVNDVLLAFTQHAQSYYSKEGREFEQFKPVLRLLRESHGCTPANCFGPKALKVIRKRMIEEDWSRKVINRRITRVRTMFKWAESEEMVPAGTTHSLATVSGLKRGEQGVRETSGVEPVFWDELAKVLPHCPSTIRTMLQLQYLAGMRSKEVRIMRWCDIDRSDPSCWFYRPAKHKNDWRDNGQQRVVPLGPKCIELLQPWVAKKSGDDYLFDPQDATNEMIAQRVTGKGRKREAVTHASSRCYSANTYAQALNRACTRVGICFRAYGLRHGRKMIIEREIGTEAARVVLGQKSIQSTQHYGKHDLARAAEVMKQVG